jgi:indole-3-glycerol phosphate synthase
MFVLLESFDEDDIQKSLMLLKESRYQEKAQEKQLLFGVNSRDLKTLQVNFNRFEEFATKMPSDIIKVAESGINNSKEIQSVKKNGYQMALIGSALMKSTQPELMIREYLIQGRGQK